MNCGIVLSFLMAFIPTQLSTTSHTETPEINATDVAPPTSAVTEVGNAFRKKYPESFLKSTINRFWNGSVGVDMTLTFRNQESVPSSTTAVQVIKDSLNARETSLDILPTSIIANTDRQNN
ncbi:uncharacterized protein [Centroberyx affinis]|uniref:uncharacterized protein isoform X3 n=1 Tax=Centroberyx affinis TaxID=166261 RepID=UPI003A5C626C